MRYRFQAHIHTKETLTVRAGDGLCRLDGTA